MVPLPEVLAGVWRQQGGFGAGMGLLFVPALPAPSQELQHGLGSLMLIGSGLFLLPNMQTAPGVRAGCAQPSPVKSCWRGLSAVPTAVVSPRIPARGQGRAGQEAVVAVEGWVMALHRLCLAALPGLAVRGGANPV